MAEIKTIEIICPACHKCEILKGRIETLMTCIGNSLGVKLKYELIHYESNKDILPLITKRGLFISQLPALLINGELVFLGHVKGDHIIRMKLEEILKY